MKMIIKQKLTVIILGFLCCVALLEIGLRIGGFVYTTLQERRNMTSLKQKGAYHIMCLGESTTADGGAFSWPSQLEGILNRSNIGVKFSVMNKGVPGIDTFYIFEHLEENLNKYTPDIVITMMGINDRDATIVYKDIPIETYRLVKLLGKNIKDKIREMKINKQERMFEKAIEKNPNNAGAYTRLGWQYQNNRMYDKAEEIFKKAIEQNPRNDLAYFEFGRCYVEQGKYDKAEEMFKKAIELNPGNDMACVELGRCYMGQGKYDKAEEMFKKVIELNPGNGMAYCDLGCCYREQKKYDKIEEMFKKAIGLNPRNDRAYFELGYYYRERKYGKAEEMLKKAIEFNSEDDRAHFELERCYKEQGKYDKAEETLKKAIGQNPGDDNAYSELAVLYELMGKNKSAQEYHQKAEEMRLQQSLVITRHNYQELKRVLDKRGIKLVCVQYPMRSVELLKKTLEPYKDIVFVDNEKLFKDAIKQGDYDDYFVDTWYVDFGHGTPKGNRLLATNIANIVLSEYFK